MAEPEPKTLEELKAELEAARTARSSAYLALDDAMRAVAAAEDAYHEAFKAQENADD